MPCLKKRLRIRYHKSVILHLPHRTPCGSRRSCLPSPSPSVTNSANISLGYLESKAHYNSLKFVHFIEYAENTGLIHWLGGRTVWITPSAATSPPLLWQAAPGLGNWGCSSHWANPVHHCPISHLGLHRSRFYSRTDNAPVQLCKELKAPLIFVASPNWQSC